MGKTQGQLYSPNEPTSKNQNFKWITLDKNLGTNHVRKYIESLSFYVYKSLLTVYHEASKILKIAKLKNKTKRQLPHNSNVRQCLDDLEIN